MELVKDINDILRNVKRFDGYLKNGKLSEKEFALRCLNYGRCFVVVKDGEDYKFYPSKYIGYKDNSNSNYNKSLDEASYGDAGMYNFDGRMSNKAITKVLGCSCQKDYTMSEKFIAYCSKYGLRGSDKKKFWLKIIEK